MNHISLPYFDFLLGELEKHNESVEISFGKHVHWGYWQHPDNANCSDNDFALAAENLTLRICDAARVAHNLRVLDTGCGFGGTLSILNDRYTGLKLTGLNIDGRQLVRAKKQLCATNDNEIALVQGDADKLPFEDNSFDRVLAVECIFHFPSRETFFREVRRVLKPGGRITLTDFVAHPMFRPASYFLSSAKLSKLSLFGSCDIQYTVNQYRQLASKLDLSMESRDITKHVLPTYRYLKRLLRSAAAPTKSSYLFPAQTIDVLHFLGSCHLLNYELLTFTKHAD